MEREHGHASVGRRRALGAYVFVLGLKVALLAGLHASRTEIDAAEVAANLEAEIGQSGGFYLGADWSGFADLYTLVSLLVAGLLILARFRASSYAFDRLAVVVGSLGALSLYLVLGGRHLGNPTFSADPIGQHRTILTGMIWLVGAWYPIVIAWLSAPMRHVPVAARVFE